MSGHGAELPVAERGAPVTPRLRTRGARFVGVGALGFAVQLGTVWLLANRGGVHYAWAAAFGVEAAVLHNFAWHERWTWRDRTAGDDALPGRLRRLVRFHLANGVASIVGNVVLTAALIEGLGLPLLVAQAVAVGSLAALNFAAAERWIFAPAADQNAKVSPAAAWK